MLKRTHPKMFVYKDAEQGYVEYKYWWAQTRRREIPFVAIRSGRRYAEVSFDHMTLDPKYDQVLDDHDALIVGDLRRLLEYYAGTKSRLLLANAKTASFVGIPNEVAETFAENLFEYYCQQLGLGEYKGKPGSLVACEAERLAA